MERLTEKAWRNLDPWECCGQDEYCRRDGHEDGGCNNGCIVPKLYSQLAKYEDLDLTPAEIREQLRKLEWYEAKFGHRLAQRWDQIAAAEDEGRLVLLDNQTALAIAAEARAIRTTKRLHGATYAYDIFGEDGGPYEIPFITARAILEKIWDEYPLAVPPKEDVNNGKVD